MLFGKALMRYGYILSVKKIKHHVIPKRVWNNKL